MKTNRTLTLSCDRPTAVAVGFFDGVHRGHQAVIGKALSHKCEGLDCCVFSFSMAGSSPMAKKGAKLLQSTTLKEQALSSMGVDWLMLPPFESFMGLTPEQFAIDVLHRGLKAQVVCCGYDYRFGKGACAGAEDLIRLLSPYGVRVEQVGAVLDEEQPISSTRIRTALAEGEIETVSRLLGRPFAIDSPVVHGQKLGSRLGFPTANQRIDVRFVYPKFGVYATRILIDDKPYIGATNIGVKPTVGSDHVAAESFILDWTGDLYGKRVETQLIAYLRPEERFESLEQLRHAIGAATEKARMLVSLD